MAAESPPAICSVSNSKKKKKNEGRDCRSQASLKSTASTGALRTRARTVTVVHTLRSHEYVPYCCCCEEEGLPRFLIARARGANCPSHSLVGGLGIFQVIPNCVRLRCGWAKLNKNYHLLFARVIEFSIGPGFIIFATTQRQRPCRLSLSRVSLSRKNIFLPASLASLP